MTPVFWLEQAMESIVEAAQPADSVSKEDFKALMLPLMESSMQAV